MRRKLKTNKKSSNSGLGLKKLTLPSYEEVIKDINKKVGKCPSPPKDLPKGFWTEQSLKVLSERYLFKDDEGNVVETPKDMCWRVAWDIASVEARWKRKKRDVLLTARTFYNLLISHEFLPGSPTLMNAGTGNTLQYSSCFVLPVEDSLVGIFDAIKYQALIHQTGGGTGFSFSRLRPRGSIVRSSKGVASGPVSFMKVFDAATNEIKQGGKRRGANMGILRVDHPDILEFIHCKENEGITNFNISVAVTDKFMQAYEEGKDYELIDPRKKEVTGKLNARKVFDEIAESAWKTGDPGLIFIDKINKGSANPVPSLGPIESTNPCVTGDTLISTQEGLVRMKEVVESHLPGGIREGGNMAVVIDNRTIDSGATGIMDSRLFRFFDVGVRDVYILKTRSGFELKATLNHKVLTPEGWKELLELKQGNSVLIQSGRGKFNQNKKINFHSEVNSYPKLWSKELGQILGWLIGDGWLRTGDKDCRVGFTFGEDDKDIMVRFKSVLNKWYGKEIKEIKRVRNTYHLSYHGKKFVDFFTNLGIQPRKAAFKKIPESLFTAPEEAVVGFLQGIFASDGTVRDSKKSNSDWIALTSKSRVLLQQIQILLLQFGIRSRIFNRSRKPRSGMFPYKAKDGSTRTYRVDGVLYELGVFGDCREQFKSEIGFLNEAKQRRLEKSRFRIRRRLKDPYLDKVDVISFYGKERVYDVTEALSHSVIANGLVVHQCGEQPLYPYDSCNLGSIFLTYFVKEENNLTDGRRGKKVVDWEKLKKVTRLATRFLDDVIEMNPYPLEQIRRTSLAIRRIGLGVGGWADMLIELGIPYDSEEAIELAGKVMTVIQEEALKSSQELAKERGVFPLWQESIYKNQKPRRNSTLTTVAPTGSISIIAGASSGIEPIFAMAYRHIVKDKNLDRTLIFVNPKFEEEVVMRGFWSDELKKKVAEHGVVREIKEIPEGIRKIFGTAHEISYDWHIKHQAAFQKYTENAVSKTINMRNEAKVEDVKNAYLLAWKTNCKGITIFRDGCKTTQVLNLGIKDKVREDLAKEPTLTRPFMVSGATYKLSTPVGRAFITINKDGDREPLELFINVGKAGSDVTAMAEALGRTISTALQFRGDLRPTERAREIAHQLSGIGGRRSVGFGPNKILSLPDAVAMALSVHFGFRINGFLNHSEFIAKEAEVKNTADGEINGENGAGKNGNGKIEIENTFVNSETQVVEGKDEINDGQLSLEDVKIVGDICPSCGESALVYQEGCSKCYSCGHSEC